MTLFIILITAAVSISAFNNPTLFHKLLFNPYTIERRKEYYRFLSHALLHADWFHLILNMFVLYSFGSMVENYYEYLFGSPKGIFYYIFLYVGGVGFASLPSFGKHRTNYNYNSVGASGAVSAVLFAAIILEPNSKVYVFAILPLKAYLFGVLYLGLEWYLAQKAADNINHDAHFVGAIFGLVFTIFLKPTLALSFFERVINGF